MRTLIVPLALAGVLLGCQQPPQEGVDAAREAVVAAESAQAEQYAKEALEEARQVVRSVEEEIAVQADKFSLLRSYERTNELIAEAQAKAAAAREAAIEGKELARSEAEAARAEVEAALIAARELLASLETCPRKPKGFKADLEAFQGRVDALASEASGIAEAIGREDFTGALAQAGAVGESLQPLVADLESAKEKIGC